MHITRLHIEGFKRFQRFDLELGPQFNVIVGDNETGKSTLLEAIALALTGKYDGRLAQYSLDPYLFNSKDVKRFFDERRLGRQPPAPRVIIEAYIQDDGSAETARLKGLNNSRGEDCPGLCLAIEVEPEYLDALKSFAADDSNPVLLPIEYYRARWLSFAGNGVTLRNLPIRASMIDTSQARISRGTSAYVTQVVADVLTEDQRRKLSIEYKKLRHGFAQAAEVQEINQHLREQGAALTSKKLEVQMDMSARASWDTTIGAHLDDLPFDCAGKGEQCRVQARLAIAGDDRSRLLLVEEPENHLSHTNLNVFMNDLQRDCGARQVIVTTHSAYVLNKLGIDQLKLLSPTAVEAKSLSVLEEETKDYFRKLPGYDTLRLVLSRRSILVEGPSDELIVQRAYKDRHGRLPIQDGVDVISVTGLAFKRFLEIAKALGLQTTVVTDNDGDVAALERKYQDYLDGAVPGVRVLWDADTDHETLEPQLLKANGLEKLNEVLGTEYANKDALLKHMKANKADCALKMFETEVSWSAPQYVLNAIN